METFDAFRYISYLRARVRVIAASGAVAVALAGLASALVQRQYTATARLVVEPPAGTDLRSAMAVSPIYLESLKTYELFAGGDSVFRQAVDHFGLRKPGRSIESMKKQVLKVGLVRNTRILEIECTLPDPVKAQGLARFLAEATVNLNRTLVSEGDQDLVQGIEQQERETRKQLDDIDAAWAKLLAAEPVAELQSAMENSAELRSGIQQRVASVELEIADANERAKGAAGGELTEINKEQGNAKARLDEMRKQLATLDRQSAEREKLLAERMAHRDRLEAERKASQTALTAIESRLRDARGETGYRGERLKIIEPGIVPERPSSPNIPLNLTAALLMGLVLPVLYFTLAMSYQEQRASGRRGAFQMAKAREE